jgi:pimeloyl-ACP methyl ester carboxylesterase
MKRFCNPLIPQQLKPLFAAFGVVACLLAAEPEARAQAKLPIVFVPGTAGSALLLPPGQETEFSTGEKTNQYWLGTGTFVRGALNKGALRPDGTDILRLQVGEPLRSLVIPFPDALRQPLSILFGLHGLPVPPDVFPKKLKEVSVYDQFMDWARRTFGPPYFYTAAYDWRKGACDENARRIGAVVDQALRSTGQKKVILVGHSLGGMVSRDYVFRYGRDKVDSIIAVGTPWLGAPKTARALLWGYNFDVGMAYSATRTSKGGGVTEFSPYALVRGLKRADGRDMQVPFHTRLSLLDIPSAKELARNWPCLYQMLPGPLWMQKYGQATGQAAKSPYFGMDVNQTLAFYNNQNPTLYSQAVAWQQGLLNGQDHGIPHFLVAGYSNPGAELTDVQDMQMARPEQVHFPVDLINGPRLASIEKAADYANVAASTAKYTITRDRYVPTEWGWEWGDGTAALLSGTAGATLKFGMPTDLNAARSVLGPNTSVQTIGLGKEFGHGSMLDDHGIRTALQRILAERNNRSLRASMNPAVVTIPLRLRTIGKIGERRGVPSGSVTLSVTVSAVEVPSGLPVEGAVMVGASQVGRTNQPFRMVFSYGNKPAIRVVVPGYPDVTVPYEIRTSGGEDF